jgi:hypothetical protein
MEQGMNDAMKHIGEQLREFQNLANTEDKLILVGVLRGLCMAYYRMGHITHVQLKDITEITSKTKIQRKFDESI